VTDDCELRRRVEALEDEVVQLRAELRCPRCSMPTPPLPRWHRDKRSIDLRPAHTCGREPWSP
jgi:hypothetical protein